MRAHRRRDLVLLLLGDIAGMALSLWAAIAVRNLALPTQEALSLHLLPFGLLFFASILVFYISGLYEPHTVVLKGKVPTLLLNATLFNALIGLSFFYFFPFVGIAPKITLLFYLIFQFLCLFAWRLYGGVALGFRRREPAILIGGGEDFQPLVDAVQAASFYGFEFIKTWNLDHAVDLDVDRDITPLLRRTRIAAIALDLAHPGIERLLPKLQSYQFEGVHFIDQSRMYEDLFDRVSLSLIGYAWILEHTSSRAHFGYDLIKRMLDVVLALILLIPSLMIYPIVALAILLTDGRPIFFLQERVGEQNRLFTVMKFRTMRQARERTAAHVTPIGRLLRATRIDELPQLWNVLIGDLSLIGPRPELPELVRYYNARIPYYSVRHLVKPGLSGWAQVHHDKHPHHDADIIETKNKLSYDLYYLKHRNVMLDIRIALKTIRTLLSRTGV